MNVIQETLDVIDQLDVHSPMIAFVASEPDKASGSDADGASSVNTSRSGVQKTHDWFVVNTNDFYA